MPGVGGFSSHLVHVDPAISAFAASADKAHEGKVWGDTDLLRGSTFDAQTRPFRLDLESLLQLQPVGCCLMMWPLLIA